MNDSMADSCIVPGNFSQRVDLDPSCLVHTKYIPGAATPVVSIRAGEVYGQADRQSVKKPIDVPLVQSRPVAESITCWSRLFHRLITRSEKKLRLRSSLRWLFSIFAEWPLVATPVFSLNMLSKLVFDHLLYILKTSRSSALFILSSKDHNSNDLSLSSHDNFFRLGTILEIYAVFFRVTVFPSSSVVSRQNCSTQVRSH